MSSTTTGTQSSSEISQQYMTLLITQLRNQNPLDPMDNNQMTAQLTGLSQLQQMESMNTSFSKVLAAEQMNQASSLIGKQITFVPAGESTTYQATVDGVAMVDGAPVLSAGGVAVALDEVRTIQNPQ